MQGATTIEVSFGDGPPVVIAVPAATCADLAQIELVARLCLLARRAGGIPKVADAPERVRELLHLAGFDEGGGVLGPDPPPR